VLVLAVFFHIFRIDVPRFERRVVLSVCVCVGGGGGGGGGLAG